MRCKTYDNYDSFKTLQSPRLQPFRQHKSSKSEDIDMLQFQNMNYSSVHEVSLNNDQNELIKKQEEQIQKLQHKVEMLEKMIGNFANIQRLQTFVSQIFNEIGLINKENIFEPKLHSLCLIKINEQKQKVKEQNKFISCLKDLVVSCSPPDYFPADQLPNLKQIWRCIKVMLAECIENKRINQEQQQLISQLTKGMMSQSQKQMMQTLTRNKLN
ncbi:unnamed protein product (macronuclear) [Paramecium tetraurelia]|uniref:Uncharacterized protein n=1 Tax=Paramecium tetraurelia TaxID=5888 RepID=A0CI11_PARTE|nr:uncharacterized protein GSPATT00038531001 [Paramecium tetraurelia]CAK70428.1 unnamed protein product [Paramecium tetraurelia]|eukprot:XP_001437825.1 hypothetical protein (macronuclear) [Paramecium tetraurelia strain d4-2]